MKKFFSLFSLILVFLFTSCPDGGILTIDPTSLITDVKLDKTNLTVNIGDSDILNVTLSPASNQSKCAVNWIYDEEFIEIQSKDNYSLVFKGKKAGGTFIKVECNGIISTCMLSVTENEEDAKEYKYIYSDTSVVEIHPRDTSLITASLYGGSVSDMENFEWTVPDEYSDIISISYSRNNCYVTAKKDGTAKIICNHPDAEENYGYTFIVFVSSDLFSQTYITTDYNVLSINRNEVSEKTITVDLVNPISADYKSEFQWSYADSNSEEIVELNGNGESAIVKPLKNGVAKIIVSHPDSENNLEIIVRVNTIVKNTYISLSESTLLVDGSETTYSVYANIENYDGYADAEEFKWEIPDDAENYFSYSTVGNCLSILGKKNGTVKVKVSHPVSEYSRTVLIILQEQIGSAVDSSMYITTDQNYVQTKVGADPTTIYVRLVGGVEGQDNIGDKDTNFSWWIEGGSNNSVVSVAAVTGSVEDAGLKNSRSAATSGEYCIGSITITPKEKGECKIYVTHPRCLYETEISVKVYSENVLLNPLTITTEDSLIKLLNGSTKSVSATLRNDNDGRENEITWSSSNIDVISVSPTEGPATVIEAKGEGSHQTYVTVHLDGAMADKKILVLSADTEDDLNSMKGIYSDVSYVRVAADETKTISVSTFGLTSSDRISWQSSDSSICIVNGDSSSENSSSAIVTGIKEGTARITASIGDAESVILKVTVLAKGESSEIFDENAGYLTTNQNAVVIENVGDSATLSVNGVNISEAELYNSTKWTITDVKSTDDEDSAEDVFELSDEKGKQVNITANRKGKAVVNVTNPSSMNNPLKMNVKCGDLYEWTDGYVVYITAENDVVNIVNGETKTIGCSLVNTTSTGTFYWNVTQGKDIIDIVGLSSGTCSITTKQAGQAIIEVTNSLAAGISKEILVNVANSDEELSGFKYLTTTQNVVSVGEGSNTSITVSIKNSDSNVVSGFHWVSDREDVAQVVDSGNIAVIYGKKIGTAKITVTNTSACQYPLEIIVNVIDPVAAAEDPYISCSNIVTCTVGGSSAEVIADLIGGSESDATGFTWSYGSGASNFIVLNSSNNSAQIKAVKEGVAQVVVHHEKASTDRTILVICEPKVSTTYAISTSVSILNMTLDETSSEITATLVNGTTEDNYGFVWYADSYEHIKMDYSGNVCVIEPITAGKATIHCTHKKAASEKVIQVYVSNYNTFAFETNAVSLETGSDTYINMEVPAEFVDGYIEYSSSNNQICTVSGNTTVCVLSPKYLEAANSSESCTITAVLKNKAGMEQAKAQLLAVVTKADETKPYLYVKNGSSTTFSMEKGEKKSIQIDLMGTTSNQIVDTELAGTSWTIANTNVLGFSQSQKTTGQTVDFVAKEAGDTIITVKHSEARAPLTLYVKVNGVNDPKVTLNYSELPIYIGESTQVITATVINDDGSELKWSLLENGKVIETQDYFDFVTNGAKASIYAKTPGTVTVRCSISNGSYADCTVITKESPKINFFVYDDEETQTEKNYLTNLQMIPGKEKILHWETIPVSDAIKEWKRGDNSYFSIGTKEGVTVGYLSSYTDSLTQKTYTYEEGVGTIILTGQAKEGTSTLTATTASYQKASISVTNSYNYLLTIDKTMVNVTPKIVNENTKKNSSGKWEGPLFVNYTVSPANAKITISAIGEESEANENLMLMDKNGNYIARDSDTNNWVITEHEKTGTTSSDGIVTGTFRFTTSGEVNCTLIISAENPEVITYGDGQIGETKIGEESLIVQSYYSKHTFKPVDLKTTANIDKTSPSNYSYYDASTNTIFLGDGERMTGKMKVQEELCKTKIFSVKFAGAKSAENAIKDGFNTDAKPQVNYIKGNDISEIGYGEYDFTLYHERDYGYNDIFYRLSVSGDKASELLNTTVKESTYVGDLVVEYFNYAAGSGKLNYKIPVYVLVRNCLCTY